MLTRRSVAGLVVASALFWGTGFQSDAQAAFKLKLDDGVAPVTVTDNGVGDTNALVGVITFSGSLTGFLVNVSTGVSKPVFSPVPEMDLNSLNVKTTDGAATLTISLTDTDYSWPVPFGVHHLFGGTLSAPGGSSVSALAYYNPGNGEFATEDLIGTGIGPFGPGAFSGTVSEGPKPADVAFGLTQIMTITFTGAGSYSGDSDLSVPEPASIALLGVGLLGVAAAARRRSRK